MIYYILALLLLIIAFPYILSAFTNLDREQYRYVYAFTGAIIALMVAYELLSSEKKQDRQALILQFQQGKTLLCDGQAVHKEKFNFVSGTLVFVGKPKTSLEGSTYPVDHCVAQ